MSNIPKLICTLFQLTLTRYTRLSLKKTDCLKIYQLQNSLPVKKDTYDYFTSVENMQACSMYLDQDFTPYEHCSYRIFEL